MSFYKKIGNVCSAAEFSECLRADFDVISVDASNVKLIEELFSKIPSSDLSTLCISFSLKNGTEEECFKVVNRFKTLFVEFNGHILPSRFLYDHISQNSVIIFSGISVDHDDDPSWILDRYIDESYSQNIYQIDLLANMSDGWSFLKNECPKYIEEIQLDDIAKITEEFSVILSIDFSEGNIKEILQALPNLNGIYFALESEVTEQRKDVIRKYQEIIAVARL